MAVYKNMTFCPFYEDCKHRHTCERPLTPEVKAKADRWWGFNPGMPPVEKYHEKPYCHEKENAN